MPLAAVASLRSAQYRQLAEQAKDLIQKDLLFQMARSFERLAQTEELLQSARELGEPKKARG